MNNDQRLTLCCFLAYAMMSGLLSQIGVLTEPLASHFDTTLTAAAQRFGSLSIGISIGSLVSLALYEFLSLKRGLIGCYVLIMASLTALYVIDDWDWLPLPFFLLGALASVGVNTAAIILAAIYEMRRRARMLLITDLCFALAGVAMPFIAARLLGDGVHWSASYLLLAVLAALLIVFAGVSRFPATLKESGAAADGGIGLGDRPGLVLLSGVGLGVYLLGQVAMLLWLPSHVQQTLGGSVTDGADAISRYWLGMACGQLVLVALLNRFSARALLLVTLPGSLAVAASLAWVADAPSMLWVMLAFGVFNAGILKLALAQASAFARNPQRVVVLVLVCASFGSAAAPAISSAVVGDGPVAGFLTLTVGCYLVSTVLLLGGFFARRETRAEPAV